jgi:hypothetical protein
MSESAFWNNWKNSALPASGSTVSNPNASGAYAGYKGGQTAGITTDVSELLNISDNDRLMISKMLVSAGYLKSATSKYNKSLGDAYTKALNDYQVEAARTGRQGLTLRVFLQENASTPTGAVSNKPSTQVASRVDDNTTADARVTKIFESLGLTPTPAQIKEWRGKLQAEQKKNPVTTKYTTKNGVTTASTTGGLEDEFWLEQNIRKAFAKDIEAVGLIDKDTAAREKAKSIYNKVTQGLTGDALAAAANKTEYGRDINAIKARINEYVLEAGGSLADADAAAKEIYDLGIAGDATQIRDYLRGKITLGDGALGGRAGSNLADLQRTAAANGLDLNKAFGGQVKTWLKNIEQGEDIDTYKRIIRGVAKLGMPDKVSTLLDQGVDLETIYSPYRRQMANLLEVDEGSISLDDPLLRSSIGPDKEMTLYDFKKAVRKDPRWQYTDNAREEVSNIALSVLRDFGFQG